MRLKSKRSILPNFRIDEPKLLCSNERLRLLLQNSIITVHWTKQSYTKSSRIVIQFLKNEQTKMFFRSEPLKE